VAERSESMAQVGYSAPLRLKQSTDSSEVLFMTPHATSRRRLLAGGAAAVTTTVAAQTLNLAPAQAETYVVNPYTATLLPNASQLHYMNRLGCGYSRSTFTQMRTAGSPGAWLNQQLAPSTIAESPTAVALPGWFTDLQHTPAQMWANAASKAKTGWAYARDLANYTMARRIYSTRTVLENMVEFWSNHLHVNAVADLAWVQRASYDNVIREHALGRFDDMLVAASLHPAMLLYLDNWKSEAGAPNENQGRELLELHTVGGASGYTEQMVKDSAKILSGYTVDARNTWAGYYDPAKHTTGAVQVLGFSAANASADGRQLTQDYLRYLAHHPATAQNIARKLARYFVSDNPSTSIIDAVASAYSSSATDIKTTLRALVAHPDFLASRGHLTRTPIEDCVATCRVLEVAALTPTSTSAFVHSLVQLARTIFVYQWPRPDGAPRGDAYWCSAGRMLDSFRRHWSLVAGWYPTQDVTYRSTASWLPQPSIRLDQYVDHLCRVLLGRSSTPRLLSAVVSGTGYGPATLITKDHALGRTVFVRLAGVLLDSPEHMRR
jgi:uncharacterized protein (DUF1800 family)